MKVGFLDVMAWVFLILSVVLIFWYMFGNSPTSFFVTSGIAGFVFVKMWNFNGRLMQVEMGTKHGFAIMKKDVDLIKSDVGLLKSDMGLVRDDLSFIRGRLKG